MILRGDRTDTFDRGQHYVRARLGVWVLLLSLALGACTSMDNSDRDGESPVLGTIAVTEVSTLESTTSRPFPSSAEPRPGRLGAGSGEPILVEYLGFGPERWEITIGTVELVTERGEDEDAEPIDPQIHVEVTLTYLGEGTSGKLLDLVFELDTPSGRFDATTNMCRPRPIEAIDPFSSVEAGSSARGILCFATQETPSALIISPLIDEPVRVDFDAG